MKPLVSIITPSYNQGRFIRDTIESVLNQDYENIEYIIIDGGSTDDTLSIIKEYKGQLSYVSEKDNGQSDAINKGFKRATGEIVAWLNSDDVYEPGCISKVVQEFEKEEKLGLLYGDGYIIDENNNKIKVFEYTQEFDFWKLINFWDYIMQPATFFRRSMLEKVGYLDVNLHYCMDWDLWIKLASISDVKYLKDVLACSREYGDTKTSTGGDRRLEEIYKLLRKYSNKSNPIGIKSYKASTFYMKHVNDIWPFNKIAHRYLVYVHNQLNKKMPLKYSDGWIAKKYSHIIPSYVKKIKLDYEVMLPQTLPQNIKIYVEDILQIECVEENTIRKTVTIELNKDGNNKELVIICDKCKYVSKNDRRKLSLLIHEIQYIK